MLRLFAITLLGAIAAPVSRADDSRDQDDRRDRYRECHARAADRGLHDANRRQYIEDCVADRLERRTLVMLGG